MVLSVEVGQFTKDATNVDGATQNVSTGFDPKAIIVWGTLLQTSNGLGDGDVSYSHGFSDGINNVCNGSDGDDGAGTEASQLTIRNTSCIFFGTVAGGTTESRATISFGTNQFTVTWVVNDSVATVINYIVIGGSSITAQAGSFLKSTAGAPVTQNVTINSDVQNISANGGIVFFASPDHDTLNNMVGDMDIGLGVAVPSSDEGQYHISNDSGVGTSEVFQTYSESKCMVITDSDSGVLQAEADFTSITTTLNITWTTNDAQASPIIFLIIKGGRWQTGNETALTAGSTKDTTTLFTPTGLITIAGRRTTEGTSQQTGSFVIGARANSTEICGGFSELDANTTMFYGRTLSNTKAIQILDQGAGAPTVDGEADASFGTNKFTMDWTNLASSAWKFLWVVMADQPKQEFTCDAIVVNRFDKTFTCDAILVNRFDETFTCDALLETTQTFNFLVDAFLELETTKLFLVDALLEMTFDETFTIDARLAQREEFTVDARLSALEEFTIDARLSALEEFTVDARLIQRKEFTCDSILIQTQTETFTCDALLRTTQIFNFLIDSLLKQEGTESFLIDSLLELRQDETFTVDARLRKVQSNTFTCDVRLKIVQTSEFDIDARLAQIKTFKIDGIVIKAIQFAVDTFTQATFDNNFTVDSIIIVFPSKVFTCDSILVARFDETFTVDSILRATQNEIFLVDSLLKKTQDKTFLVDAELETTNTETFTLDARLRAVFTETFTVDALLRKTQDETFNVDGLLENTFDNTFTIDGLLEETFDETLDIDAVLVSRFDVNFTIDAILRATQNFNFTIDGIPFVVPSALFLIDASIIISGIESFTIDARVKLTSSLVSTVDAILKATFAETLSIDAVLYLPIYNTFSIDALLEKEKVKTFTVDAVLEQAKTKIFTLDSILTPAGATVAVFLVDARLRLTQTETFTVQARLRYVQTKTYTIDAVLKMTGDTLCSVLTPIFSDNFDSSTGWTTFGLITVDSIANPNVLRYNCVNSPNPGSQAIKTLPIPTGEEFRIEFTHNNVGGCTGFESYAVFGLTDTTTRIGHQFAIVPKIEYRINAGDGPDGEGIRILYRSTISDPVLSTATAIPMNNNTTYYVRIDKNLASIITLSMFSDSARTIHVTGSPVQLDVSSQIKVPFLYVQASNVGPAGPGSARKYTGEIEDLVIYADRCPNFLIDSYLQDTFDENFTVDAKLVYRTRPTIDALLSKRKTKTFTIDTFTDIAIQGNFTIDAYLVRLHIFSLDALIKALGDNRCPFENIFEEHFTTTSNWSIEVNNTVVDGWGTQKIFIDGESLLSQEPLNGIAYIQMPPGGYTGAMQPILKSKYRRKKLDSYGGIGKVRGNNIRVDFELTYLSGTKGRFIVLNKSSLHPDNDPNTSSLHINSAGLGIISATLDDGFVNVNTPTLNVGTGTKRYIVMESLGNTLTLNAYTDITHTTHIAGSPVNVDTSSVNKEQLDLSWLIIGANDKSAPTAEPDTIGKVDNIKIFSSPCPVAYVDAHLSGFSGETFSISARLVRESKFSIDARLRGIKLFNIDAYIVRNVYSNVDAVLLASPLKTFTVDPLLKGAVNKIFTIDGIPFVPPAELITIDAIVNLQNVDKTFSIDAVLIEGVFFTFTIDAFLIQFTINKQFTVDSRIRETNIQTFYIDALIKMLGVNGICNFYPNTNFAIDTGLEQFMGPITPDHEESVDMLIGQEVVLNNQQVRRVTFLLRASGFPNEITDTSLITGKIWSNVVVGNLAGEIVEATSENTINAQNISGDLPSGVWKEIIFTYDNLTTPFLTGNYVIGLQHFVGVNTNAPKGVGIAIPVISDSNVIFGSAVMRRESNSIIDPLTWMYLTTISKDIVIRVEVINGDDIIEGIGNHCPKCDAVLQSAFTEVLSTDAVLYLPIYETFEIDAELVNIKIKNFLIDAIVIGGIKRFEVDAILIPSLVIFSIDGLLLVEPGKLFSVDSILKGTINETFFIDADLKTEDINKIFNCNALIAEIKTKIFTIDGTTKYFNKVAPFIVDAFIINEPSKFFFVDAIVKKFGAENTININAYLKIIVPFIFTVDVLLKKENEVNGFLTDTILIVKDKEITFDITASLAVTQPPVLFIVDAITYFRNVRWRIDGLLRLRKVKTFTCDALLADRIELTSIVDALVKKLGVLQTVIVDALVKKIGTSTFIIDTFAEQPNTKVFTIDAKLVFPFKMTTIDSKIVNRYDEIFIIDSFIDPPHTVKPLVDALIKCLACSGNLFCTNTFTIDALVGVGQAKVTVDAKLNKTNAFTISAFIGELIDVGIEAESVINDGSMIGIESTFGIGGT